jgi:hypothetical protein
MAGQMTFRLIDESEEYSSVKLWTPDLDDSNINAYTNDNPTGVMGDMRLALNGLTIANHVSRTVLATKVVEPAASAPADPNAQRERKALVTYRDNVNGNLFQFTIPAYNMVGKFAGSDKIDITVGAWSTLVSEFEANFVSPYGNACTVVSAKHIGVSN